MRKWMGEETGRASEASALGQHGVREHDADIVLWSEHQSALLRRIAAGEMVNSAEIDWSNIAEEIETVGWMQVDAVESLLFQALVHMLKTEAWPHSPSAPIWREEARRFRAQARRRFMPSMHNRIDLAGLYADALRALPEKIEGQEPLPVSKQCPVTLDGLLSEG